ncbi:TPA: transposase [Legionella pneumophila]|nr:transposase [Legionella pneumophila]
MIKDCPLKWERAGFHRKMKLIQRRAYGFRNFENYRVRVRVLCG